MIKLPDELSELLWLGICNLQTCHGDPRYEIGPGYWHYGYFAAPCKVSMAGAVIAQTLGADPNTVWYPEQFKPHTRSRLWAIDMLSRGRLGDAAAHLGLDSRLGVCDVPPSYDDRFFAIMSALFRKLC